MEIDSGRLPVEGDQFKFTVVGGIGMTQIEVRLNGRTIFQGKCPDPPCHEMIHIPLGTGGAELVVIAQDSGGNAVERKFLVAKREGGANSAMTAGS
ncbi:hypothetical protein ACRAVF_07295 [Bradyrhizobium oligotrophicum S58]